MLNRQRREKPLVRAGDRRRRARRARALRRRLRHLHRRPLVHPPVGLPVAVDQAEPGPAAHRPGRDRARQLRRLRRVRRGRRTRPCCARRSTRRRIVSNPTALGPLARSACARAVIGALQRRDARRRARFAF